LHLSKNVDLYPCLFDPYIPLHFEQFDVIHDDSSNASIPTMRLYTCHVVKSIVFKSNVDEPCVNSVSERCFNFVDEPCATFESGVLEGKFDYEFASRKPCSKS